MASRSGGFSVFDSNSEPWVGCASPFFFRTASMMVRGSIRSWTCSETVGTSNDVRSAFPPRQAAGQGAGRNRYFFAGLSWSVSGVTSPTGGLLARFLSLWSYCSIGFLDGWDEPLALGGMLTFGKGMSIDE